MVPRYAVRSGPSVKSTLKCYLTEGVKISVTEKLGNRIRITSPANGWCSIQSKKNYKLIREMVPSLPKQSLGQEHHDKIIASLLNDQHLSYNAPDMENISTNDTNAYIFSKKIYFESFSLHHFVKVYMTPGRKVVHQTKFIKNVA